MEIKLPDGFDNREEAIRAIIKKESDAGESELVVIKKGIGEFLLNNKGYSKDEVEADREFDVETGNEKCKSKADIVVSIDGKRLMIVKCSIGALVSRERQAVACARLMDSYQIPFAVVTDGNDAILLDTLTGKAINEGLEKIPSRDELKAMTEKVEFKELSPERLEKEKRILLAFDSIKCSIIHGE